MGGWDSIEEAWRKKQSEAPKHWDNYLGFYSSWLDGYFREPWGMVVPMDDHGFHRGDGVFEAARLHHRAFIDLPAHLKRLQNSAASIGMQLPKTIEEISEICVRLGRLSGADNGVLRLYVTRGPGGFSPSPNEVTGHQVYAAITQMAPPREEVYRAGCRAMLSTVRAKDPFWSQIKSCNYLQNVLMKRETLEKGYDFAISRHEDGRLCEGATENLLLLTGKDEILVPRFDYTLRGTTVSEVMRIAESLIPHGKLKAVRLADVTVEDLQQAKEAAFVGTTLGVLPITSIDDRQIGEGVAGPICRELHQLLMRKMATDPALRTVY